MKGMFGKLKFKPSDLKTSCESEGFAHKAKIVCFSLAMFTVANTYASYFQNLVYRSGIYQQHALAAKEQFMEYIDGSDPRTLWEEKNLLDVLDEKDFKQLKFMQAGWKDTEYNRRVFKLRSVEKADANDSNNKYNGNEFYWEDEKIWSDANGDEKDNQYYFTQKQRMDGEKVQTDDRTAYNDRTTWSGKRYDEWATMHDGTIWFDTAGCLTGSKIGEVNAATVSPKVRDNETLQWNNSGHNPSTNLAWNGMKKQWVPVRQDMIDACTAADAKDKPWNSNCFYYTDQEDQEDRFKQNKALDSETTTTPGQGVATAGWYYREPTAGAPESKWWTSSSSPYSVTYDSNQVVVQDKSEYTDPWGYKLTDYNGRPIYSADQYGVDINVGGKINWRDEDLYRDLLKDYIDMVEDCDIDCQKSGSQLTLIGSLMATSYGVVALNAIFMFVGTWRYRWRFCSIICTLLTCVCQLVISIVVGALLFTKYNAVCSRSMVKTYGKNMIWTMADDFYVTFSLWVISFIAMFIFCCCGLCQSYRPDK